MRKHALTLAPWCILAVVLLAGAAEEKPVPKYMQLMLAEEAAQTDLLKAILAQQLLSHEVGIGHSEGMLVELGMQTLLASDIDTDIPAQKKKIDNHIRGVEEANQGIEEAGKARRNDFKNVIDSWTRLQKIRTEYNSSK